MSQVKSDKLKLMVVDDEPDNLDLLYRTFRREFHVFKAESGFSALDILEQEGEMAVIISDQRMPMMNGTEFLSKTVEQFPDTIRILLTGYTDVDDLVEAINSGKVFKYITKPWNPENLKSIIKQAGETYRVVKQRTNELTQALRKEELFNNITRTIRESLDYHNTLQTIVTTIGENFTVNQAILKPIHQNKITDITFCYTRNEEDCPEYLNLVEKAITSQQMEFFSAEKSQYLAFPLVCQHELLAILVLHHEESAWSESDLTLLSSVADQASLAISQARLYQQVQQQAEKMSAELEVARQIQHNLLREALPTVEGVKVQAICNPARQVGGDFFEVYDHPQGDIWIAVGDVSGKGVPAALFMASALSILRRELTQEVSPHPQRVLENLNQAMSEDLYSTNCFITMVIARYNPVTRQLVYANAGHLYPMLWSHPQLPDTPNYLKSRGIPVGILPQWRGKIGEEVLQSGDVFLLTSDGITEATLITDSPDHTPLLNQEGLWELILQDREKFDLDRLLSRFRDCTSPIQEDDQTVVALEVL